MVGKVAKKESFPKKSLCEYITESTVLFLGIGT